MGEWLEKQIDEIAEFNPRESIPKGTIAKKIAMDKLQPFCRDVPGFEKEIFSGGTKFRNGDTIMARITPCLENGKTAKVDVLDDGEVGFGSTEYIVFRAKEGYDPDFIYYLVTSPVVREPAIKSMVGSSGRQRVQTDVVQKLKIKVPRLEEQREIAGIMKSLDDKIATNRRINDNLQQQAQAIYKHLIVDNSQASWTPGHLSDIAIVTMGQSPKGESYNEEGAGTIFFQGRAEFGFRFPTRRLYTTEPKRMANANDVLMSVRAPVGDINVAYEDCCIGRGLGSIRSKDGHQSFILYTMLAIREQLEVFNGEGTVFGSINRDALNSLSINIPPIELVNQFESIVAPMDATIRNNYDEICNLQVLRDNLLPRLMSGEIDVSDIEL